MRLILALSIALGTANLTIVPTDTGLDLMTRADDSTRAPVAETSHPAVPPRLTSITPAFDRSSAITNLASREVGATPSGVPTGFTMRVVVDAANVGADDITIADAATATVVR